jgi:hypothetical protein
MQPHRAGEGQFRHLDLIPNSAFPSLTCLSSRLG